MIDHDINIMRGASIDVGRPPDPNEPCSLPTTALQAATAWPLEQPSSLPHDSSIVDDQGRLRPLDTPLRPVMPSRLATQEYLGSLCRDTYPRKALVVNADHVVVSATVDTDNKRSPSPQHDIDIDDANDAHCARLERKYDSGHGCANTMPTPQGLARDRAHVLRKVFRKRGIQRWTALLTSTTSRIGHSNGMRARLGPRHWSAFVAYANALFRPAFVAVFEHDMRCAGPLADRPPGAAALHTSPVDCCPRAFYVSPTREDDVSRVAGLHLDHAYEVHFICDVWKQCLDELGNEPREWSDGIDRDLLCQLLFGVVDHPNVSRGGERATLWRANLQLRCGLIARAMPLSIRAAMTPLEACPQSRSSALPTMWRPSGLTLFCHTTIRVHRHWTLTPSDLSLSWRTRIS